MTFQLALICAAAFCGAFCGSFIGTMWATTYRDMKGPSR
jgi:uncharacterized membrane protein YjjB (DUF3815 family)